MMRILKLDSVAHAVRALHPAVLKLPVTMAPTDTWKKKQSILQQTFTYGTKITAAITVI